MGKKKFVNKKKSATFQLLYRDSSDANFHGDSTSDRVLCRIDKNPNSHGLLNDDNGDDHPKHRGQSLPKNDPNSIFADAIEDEDEDAKDFLPTIPNPRTQTRTPGPLPDHIRREILELGFPDDGYNYLLHLREIKNSGGGSSFYHNRKAKLDQVPHDVKAYDASKLRIFSKVDDDLNPNSIYSVASKAVGVRIQKAVDPSVAALLDDSDQSRFASDVEDLEEDFVIQANLPNRDKEITVNGQSPVTERSQEQEGSSICEAKLASHLDKRNHLGVEKPRILRPLDKKFDLFALQEYGSDNKSNCDSDDSGSVATVECESLAAKLKDVLKGYTIDDLDLAKKYIVPGDFKDQGSSRGHEEEQESPADVIRRCAEYAEMYANESQEDEETEAVEDSSNESEIWDCETIISTYSNLDNHPGKIEAPAWPRKKPIEAPSGAPGVRNSRVISLRGKEKLPVEFLPHSRKAVVLDEKKRVAGSLAKTPLRVPGEETKQKKERKAAVKAERREARQAKKELKGLYRGEAQRAQKVAAVSGPCAIHLM